MFSTLKSLILPTSKQWQAHDFSGIDQLHLGGIGSTQELITWLPSDLKRGLDIGCGLGGTSRYLALHKGCSMTGLDLNDDYIRCATLLNQSLTTVPDCHFVVGNSLTLPFSARSFDFVVSQHASMNIDNKGDLLTGIFKVLNDGGQFLLHEVMLQPNINPDCVDYPTPWASNIAASHLLEWQQFVDEAIAVGFTLTQFEDNTASALNWIRQTRKTKPKPPFTPLLALGPTAGAMSANVLANIEHGRLQVVSALLSKQPA